MRPALAGVGIMAILQDMSQAELLAKVAQLEAANAALRQARQGKLTMKVSEKGAISIYGFGKWPVTLYRSQIERLLDAVPQIRAFIEANADQLSEKA